MESTEVQGATAEQQREMILETPEPSTSIQLFYSKGFSDVQGKYTWMEGRQRQKRESFFAFKW